MAASLIGVVTLRQPQVGLFGAACIFFRGMVAQPFDGLPMRGFFLPSLTLDSGGLKAGGDGDLFTQYRDSLAGRLPPPLHELSAIPAHFAKLARRLLPERLPMGERFLQSVSAVLLAAQIAQRPLTRLALLVAVAFDQIVTLRIARPA